MDTHPTQTLPTAALPPSLRFDIQGEVGILTLNRPEKRNALGPEMVEGLARLFAAPPAGVRAILLHAEGAHFSAGLDLASLVERSPEESVRLSRLWHRAFDLIQNGEIPVVAALHGAVVGGGLELACACHIRVAETTAYYALPEGRHGIFVGGGGSVRIARLISVARMTDMMLTGRIYKGAEGEPLGFSQYVVEPGQAYAKGLELAQQIAKNTPLTNYAVLQALPKIAESSEDAGLFIESLMSAICSTDEAATARLRTFLSGRGTKVKPTA